MHGQSRPQLRVLQKTCWNLPTQPIAHPPDTTTLLVARYLLISAQNYQIREEAMIS